MRTQAISERTGALVPGDFVCEEGTAVRGRIIGRGDYTGEWRLALRGGGEVTCLEVNLVREDEARREE